MWHGIEIHYRLLYGVEEKACDIPVQLSSSLEGQKTSRIESILGQILLSDSNFE